MRLQKNDFHLEGFGENQPAIHEIFRPETRSQVYERLLDCLVVQGIQRAELRIAKLKEKRGNNMPFLCLAIMEVVCAVSRPLSLYYSPNIKAGNPIPPADSVKVPSLFWLFLTQIILSML